VVRCKQVSQVLSGLLVCLACPLPQSCASWLVFHTPFPSGLPEADAIGPCYCTQLLVGYSIFTHGFSFVSARWRVQPDGRWFCVSFDSRLPPGQARLGGPVRSLTVLVLRYSHLNLPASSCRVKLFFQRLGQPQNFKSILVSIGHSMMKHRARLEVSPERLWTSRARGAAP
jgi:hypothetical protein